MAKRQKASAAAVNESVLVEADDLTKQLIAGLNKEFGTRVAYNLSTEQSPTHVKRWISTGSILLDYIVSNRRDGGVPEGRIIEIAGKPSIGKSHIAFHIARTVQRMGGIVVYIDTENAVPTEKLAQMGIDTAHRFVYCDTHCTEEVFAIAEKTIVKAKSITDRDVPILIVWDSVAATSPKQELEGDYDKETMGLQARAIAKGMRKITGVIGQNNVTMVCLNQLKSKVGMVMGDPNFTPGGQAIPYHASVRLRLTGGQQIEDKNKNVIGIRVNAKTIKNKVTSPFRECSFNIIFGQGIEEGENTFDVLREACKEGPIRIGENDHLISGDGGWKEFLISDGKTGEVLVKKKFTKSQFGELLADDTFGPRLKDMLEKALVVQTGAPITSDDGDAPAEVKEAENSED